MKKVLLRDIETFLKIKIHVPIMSAGKSRRDRCSQERFILHFPDSFLVLLFAAFTPSPVFQPKQIKGQYKCQAN